MSIVAEYKDEAKLWYAIPYPASAYTYPKANLIESAQIDDACIHLKLTDGRSLAIPLHWMPSVWHAPAEERNRFLLSEDRRALIWDPDDCSINDELFIDDYLTPRQSPDS